MDEQTYLSLFAGIGGLDLAVEAHGFRCVGQVEFDPACSAVLARHWPDVPRWADVHGFSAAAYADERRGDADRSVQAGRGEPGPRRGTAAADTEAREDDPRGAGD